MGYPWQSVVGPEYVLWYVFAHRCFLNVSHVSLIFWLILMLFLTCDDSEFKSLFTSSQFVLSQVYTFRGIDFKYYGLMSVSVLMIPTVDISMFSYFPEPCFS